MPCKQFEKLIKNNVTLCDSGHTYDLSRCLWLSKFHRMSKARQLVELNDKCDEYWHRATMHARDNSESPGNVEDTLFHQERMWMFNEEMMGLVSCYCHQCCEERWIPSKGKMKDKNRNTICRRCSRGDTSFSRQNDMIPVLAPRWIRKSSALMRRITAPACALQKIYCASGGTLRSKGNTIALEQDLKGFTKVLPTRPSDTGWVQIQREGDEKTQQHPDLLLDAKLTSRIIGYHIGSNTPGQC